MDTPLNPIDRVNTADAFDRVYATERATAERERVQAVGKQKKKKHEQEHEHAEPEDRVEVSGLTNTEQDANEQESANNADTEQKNQATPGALDVQA